MKRGVVVGGVGWGLRLSSLYYSLSLCLSLSYSLFLSLSIAYLDFRIKNKGKEGDKERRRIRFGILQTGKEGEFFTGWRGWGGGENN